MGAIKLPHASGNSMSIAAPATNPASDLELKLPATIGTANQYLKNSSTPGTLEFGTLTAGKVVQIVAVDEANILSNPTSMTTHIDVDITPTSASSKFVAFYSTFGTLGNDTEIQIVCEDGTFTGGIREFRNYHTDKGARIPVTCTWFMDQTHGTGSAVTYAVKAHRTAGSDTAQLGSTSALYKTSMVVMEVTI